MTEQDRTPDMDLDDTEGHVHRDDEDQDTEGHIHRDDEDEDDTEGHTRHF
jgi:hypothetical protein